MRAPSAARDATERSGIGSRTRERGNCGAGAQMSESLWEANHVEKQQRGPNSGEGPRILSKVCGPVEARGGGWGRGLRVLVCASVWWSLVPLAETRWIQWIFSRLPTVAVALKSHRGLDREGICQFSIHCHPQAPRPPPDPPCFHHCYVAQAPTLQTSVGACRSQRKTNVGSVPDAKGIALRCLKGRPGAAVVAVLEGGWKPVLGLRPVRWTERRGEERRDSACREQGAGPTCELLWPAPLTGGCSSLGAKLGSSRSRRWNGPGRGEGRGSNSRMRGRRIMVECEEGEKTQRTTSKSKSKRKARTEDGGRRSALRSASK
ncbi:hypothetical protein AXG93_3507s1180 [Marchantia polymorpha subsp. ruderalis]|uniref:Uncharacterized protein n=1 Tax=Marchantia polymorpha subsp. ruderalis TaxID=1480154 RepID=A0A176VHH6_MARPO|nr:hypothetical protein AXG93_3507s1180 [Marchantia polymorpha subsp. ruderalis]